MAFTNGFNYDVILPALKGRVGWRSDTGTLRSFESFHALCTEQNLRDVQPSESISDSDFTALKDTLEDEIIQRCLSSVFSQPEQIEQALLHNRVGGSQRQTVTNSSKFCGISFRLAPAFDVSVSIKSVTLLFDEVRTFNLYLFRDGFPDPIETISVTTEANKPTELDITDLTLSYSTGSSLYYLGYFQDDLAGAQAISEVVVCNQTKMFAAINMQAPSTGAAEFNQSEISYIDDGSIGLNVEVHSFRDYTAKIINSAHLFDEIIGLSMAAYVVEQIVYTVRSNGTERLLKAAVDSGMAYMDLNGSIPISDSPKIQGLQRRIEEKRKALREVFYSKKKSVVVNYAHY